MTPCKLNKLGQATSMCEFLPYRTRFLMPYSGPPGLPPHPKTRTLTLLSPNKCFRRNCLARRGSDLIFRGIILWLYEESGEELCQGALTRGWYRIQVREKVWTKAHGDQWGSSSTVQFMMVIWLIIMAVIYWTLNVLELMRLTLI